MKWVHKGPPKIDSVRNEINVTPLVDVCLVLLIIFMVVLPMLSRGKEVRLPQTSHHREPQDTRQPIVSLDAKGRIYVGKEQVKDLDQMKSKLTEEYKALVAQNNLLASGGGDTTNVREGENRVLVKADKDLDYGDVYPVIMALHELEIPNIDLGTNEMKKGE
jgi:biopolymer transport protein ExbD